MIDGKEEYVGSQKSISATLYPERIILVTKNKKENEIWYSTDNISIIENDVSDLILGELVIKRLNDSKEQIISNDGLLDLRDNYKKITGLSSEKAVMKNARYVSIFLKSKTLIFEPYKNMLANKILSFNLIPNEVFTFPVTDNFSNIGQKLREAWARCCFA